jgi:hypothetical protein
MSLAEITRYFQQKRRSRESGLKARNAIGTISRQAAMWEA